MGKGNNSIAKSTGIMTAATMLSRITGLGRTWAMAFALGNTIVTSAYQVAYNMPSVIYDLVAGGIIGTAFLPIYLLQREKLGAEGGDRFASNILNLAVVILGVLSILASVFAPQIIATQTFTVSDTAQVTQTATMFLRVFAVQIVLYGLGGVITGVLNANRMYGAPTLAPVFNNIVVMMTMFSYVPISAANPDFALWWLAGGTSLGVAVQFGIQIPMLVKIGFKYVLKINLHDPALREAMRIALPTLVYIAGTLVSYSCRNAFSLQAGENGPSTLSYAWMWYQLPYGVIAVSISTAFLTEMSEAMARGDMATLRSYASRGLRTTLFLIIPLAGMMFALGVPIIQIFKAGAFDQESVYSIAQVLQCWVVSLPFYAGQMFFYRVFASLRQFLTFALVSCGLCTVQIFLYWQLTTPEVLGLLGIPVADCVYFALQFFIMALILRKRVGGFGFMSTVWMGARTIVATGIGMAVVEGVLLLIPLQPSIGAALVEIVLCGTVGLIVTFTVCRLLRIPEMDFVVNILRKIGTKLGIVKSPRGKHAKR